MKRVLVALTAIAATTLGVVGSTPAQAAEPRPADTNGYRFWTGSICIDGSAINGTTYRVAYIAQEWNNRVGNKNILALQYEDDCAAAGYPPSRRMVIGKFNNPESPCVYWTNPQASLLNGMYRWTNGPGRYINTALSDCVGTQAKRDHYISFAIGTALGLNVFYPPEMRTMSNFPEGAERVPLPDAGAVQRVREIYSGKYGG